MTASTPVGDQHADRALAGDATRCGVLAHQIATLETMLGLTAGVDLHPGLGKALVIAPPTHTTRSAASSPRMASKARS